MLKKKHQQQHKIVSSPTLFPSGIAVRTEKNVYWIKDGKRFRLISERAVQSWAFTIVHATEAALSGSKVVGKLGFRDGTLIKNIADGKIYLILGLDIVVKFTKSLAKPAVVIKNLIDIVTNTKNIY